MSWRAHLAGARVVVAPQARARHLEAGARACAGRGPAARRRRPRTAATEGPRPGSLARGGKRTTDEQRLRVLWTCYGAAGLVLVAPLAVLFAFAESFWALLHPRSGRGVVDPLRSLARSFQPSQRPVGRSAAGTTDQAGERPGHLEGAEPGQCSGAFGLSCGPVSSGAMSWPGSLRGGQRPLMSCRPRTQLPVAPAARGARPRA